MGGVMGACLHAGGGKGGGGVELDVMDEKTAL